MVLTEEVRSPPYAKPSLATVSLPKTASRAHPSRQLLCCSTSCQSQASGGFAHCPTSFPSYPLPAGNQSHWGYNAQLCFWVFPSGGRRRSVGECFFTCAARGSSLGQRRTGVPLMTAAQGGTSKGHQSHSVATPWLPYVARGQKGPQAIKRKEPVCWAHD